MSFLEATARQEVKRWLSPYVLRGDSIEYIGSSWMGIGSNRLSAQVGNYVRFDGKIIKLGTRQVAVTMVGGVPCLYIFSLADLYEEVLHPEAAVRQPSLF